MKRLLGRAWLRLHGWKSVGILDQKKFVLIAAPHTSNWDLLFMLAVAADMGVRVRWLGKHTLFRGPMGWLMRGLGGIPVDRGGRHNMVEQAAALFADADALILAVPPEGTRKSVRYWRSGFYWIAHQAKVPIGLGFLDYGKRRGGVGGFVWTTGDVRKDLSVLRDFYADKRGKIPAFESVPRLREEDESGAAA
ncbi:MAG: 1-acyl-sn-glycerol-3-phosphate acyltransferase [Nannocystaceae bacterium]